MAPRLPLPPLPSPNVRRSNRASLPDTYLMYRREIIREKFCKTAVQTPKKKLNVSRTAIKSKFSAKVQSKSKNGSKRISCNNRKQRYVNRQTKLTKPLSNRSSCGESGEGDDTADAQKFSAPAFTDGLIESKKEKLDDTMDEASIPKRFGNC